MEYTKEKTIELLKERVKNHTVYSVAKGSGLTNTTIDNILKGKCNARDSTLKAIYEYLVAVGNDGRNNDNIAPKRKQMTFEQRYKVLYHYTKSQGLNPREAFTEKQLIKMEV